MIAAVIRALARAELSARHAAWGLRVARAALERGEWRVTPPEVAS